MEERNEIFKLLERIERHMANMTPYLLAMNEYHIKSAADLRRALEAAAKVKEAK